MIRLASDHGGYDLKQDIKKYLEENNIEYKDYGCDNNQSCDYPDYAHNAANNLKNDDLGIFICGTGNGINMAANAHNNVRSALCWEPTIAYLARAHNNANVMALPGRFMKKETAIKCVKEFLKTEFEGGRHQRRIDKIKVYQ
jgi:ribose 5-phosphate isomerase B